MSNVDDRNATTVHAFSQNTQYSKGGKFPPFSNLNESLAVTLVKYVMTQWLNMYWLTDQICHESLVEYIMTGQHN